MRKWLTFERLLAAVIIEGLVIVPLLAIVLGRQVESFYLAPGREFVMTSVDHGGARVQLAREGDAIMVHLLAKSLSPRVAFLWYPDDEYLLITDRDANYRIGLTPLDGAWRASFNPHAVIAKPWDAEKGEY